MDEIIRVNKKDIINLRDETKRINEFSKSRFEESEKILKFNVDTIT